jgi:hypothetical protein
MSRSYREMTGRLVATALSCSWRANPQTPNLSLAELEHIAPLLLRFGSGGLAWWRLQNSPLATSAVAEDLHQAYRLNTLESVINESKITQAVSAMRAAGVDPILIKGWSCARTYPQRGLRPYGDIDLCVRPDDYSKAMRVVDDLNREGLVIDLHRGLNRLGKGDFSELCERSRLHTLQGIDVRIPGPEDHLRIVAFHLLREGGWRALWLCDVAAAIESRDADFDWSYCLREPYREHVLCAAALAHVLLGAIIDDIPRLSSEISSKDASWNLPEWAVPTVLKEWGSSLPSMTRRHTGPMSQQFRHPANIFAAIAARWPNSIEATATMRAPFNNWPRWPVQLANCAARVAGFLLRKNEE